MRKSQLISFTLNREAPVYATMVYEGVKVEFHSLLNSALGGRKWSASRHCRFTLGQRARWTHWTRSWVGLKPGLYDLEKRKPPCPYWESNHSSSVVQLRSLVTVSIVTFFFTIQCLWTNSNNNLRSVLTVLDNTFPLALNCQGGSPSPFDTYDQSMLLSGVQWLGSGARRLNNDGSIPEWADHFSFQSVHTGSEGHITSHTKGNGVLSGGQSGWGMKLTTHLHLVPMLRMHGAIPLLPHTSSRRLPG